MEQTNKEALVERYKKELEEKGLEIQGQDLDRPWGGFFIINEDQAERFIQTYFDDVKMSEANISGRLSPKILFVAPDKRLSWQYHHRRAEMWQILEGPVGVIKSLIDEQKEMKTFNAGERVSLKQGERHRLIGLEQWGVVAEIWQHVYADHPSNEKDIVRLEDDFGR